jgi:hypothetical protein
MSYRVMIVAESISIAFRTQTFPGFSLEKRTTETAHARPPLSVGLRGRMGF